MRDLKFATFQITGMIYSHYKPFFTGGARIFLLRMPKNKNTLFKEVKGFIFFSTKKKKIRCANLTEFWGNHSLCIETLPLLHTLLDPEKQFLLPSAAAAVKFVLPFQTWVSVFIGFSNGLQHVLSWFWLKCLKWCEVENLRISKNKNYLHIYCQLYVTSEVWILELSSSLWEG